MVIVATSYEFSEQTLSLPSFHSSIIEKHHVAKKYMQLVSVRDYLVYVKISTWVHTSIVNKELWETVAIALSIFCLIKTVLLEMSSEISA